MSSGNPNSNQNQNKRNERSDPVEKVQELRGKLAKITDKLPFPGQLGTRPILDRIRLRFDLRLNRLSTNLDALARDNHDSNAPQQHQRQFNPQGNDPQILAKLNQLEQENQKLKKKLKSQQPIADMSLVFGNPINQVRLNQDEDEE